MQFFIDTANLAEIGAAHQMGVLAGVTTNPSLIAKIVDDPAAFTWQMFKDHISQICQIVDGPVSAEVTALDADGMIAEGEELAEIAENVVIKCPVTMEGLKAITYFDSQDIATNATLVFSANQALLAANAGASYVSPFVGRLDDVSSDGMALVKQIVTMFKNYDYMPEVIVASIRHPQHVIDAAMVGADIATIPYSVIRQLLSHPLTDQGVKKFTEDAAIMKK